MNYDKYLDEIVEVTGGTGGGGGGSAMVATNVTAAASGTTTIAPMPGYIYNVVGDVQTGLVINDWTYDSTKEWEINFGFASGAAATVTFNLAHPHSTINQLGSDFTFEAGKKYCIRCRYNRIKRYEITEVRVLGYDLVSYLTSSGTQYIDTGIKLHGDYSVKVTFGQQLAKQDDVFRGVFGSRETGLNFAFYQSTTNTVNIGAKYYDSNVYGMYYSQLGNFTTVEMIAGKTLFDGVEKGTTPTAASFEATKNCYLFMANFTSDSGAICSVARFEIFDGDSTKLQDLVSARWLANRSYIDGNSGETVTPTAAKPGMLDLVTGKFFTNRDSGTDFTCGA